MEKPDFESIKRFNVLGHEYWSARELMPLLGYGKKWQNFEKVIRKATISAQKAELPLEGHFTGVSKMSSIGQGGQRPTQDYFLSRRACYLIAQNGDPRKPEIAAAQQYFAVSTEVLNDLSKLRVEQEQRLALRMKVSHENHNLAETALQAGVKRENMPVFEDAGYLGMYLMTENQLAVFWNIGANERILDVMGPEALAANLFRITQTDAKLKRDKVKNEDVAIATHHDVGATVRKAIEEIHQQKPEDLPRAENIRKLVEAERRKERKRIKNKPSDEQGTLF